MHYDKELDLKTLWIINLETIFRGNQITRARKILKYFRSILRKKTGNSQIARGLQWKIEDPRESFRSETGNSKEPREKIVLGKGVFIGGVTRLYIYIYIFFL